MINLPGSWNMFRPAVLQPGIWCPHAESFHVPGMCYGRWAPVFLKFPLDRIWKKNQQDSGRSANSPFLIGSWRRPLGLGSYGPTFIPHAWLTGGGLTPCKIWLGRCWGHPSCRILRALRLPTWFCYHSSPAPFLQNGPALFAAKSQIGKSDFREGTPHMRHGVPVHLFIQSHPCILW